MCGICGFVGHGDLDDLKRMNAVLVHRGPDAEGLWYDVTEGVYLGHRRLSIIDLEGGAQPMWSEDGRLCVVFNGEIYNHLELRKSLERKGHRFRSDHSDTEVLLYGYRAWGHSLPDRLNGMWAFAVYDKIKRELFLSRDRFGKKPLYYSVQKNTFAFSSELNSLIRHREIKAHVSKESLTKYFAYGYIPAPLSLYEQIYKLPGGCNLVLGTGGLRYSIHRYWDFVLEPAERVPKAPEEEWGEAIRELLLRAVKRRLMSDVPLGVFLSGGIDSSSVAACAAKISGSDRVKSFSIGFTEASFDESEHSRRVASLIGSEHHLKILSMERAGALLPEIVRRLDEPMGDSSLLPTYLLCRETREHVTVALGGDGGDELFAGYDPFRALKRAELYGRLVPGPVHEGIRMLMARLPVSHRNMSLDFKLKRTLRGLSYPKALWNPVWLGPLCPEELEELFHEPMDPEQLYSEAIQQWENCRQDNLIDRTLQFYTKLYLQDGILTKVDRASMMNSLEVRAPYLDRDLVDLLRRIPARYKYRNGVSKYILKKALEPLLPRHTLHRPKKGFGVPLGRWLRDGRLEFRFDAGVHGMDPDFFRRQLISHQKGREDNRLSLWNYWLLAHHMNRAD
jgi:asparagine synthase (glutamine-hydrolysing)